MPGVRGTHHEPGSHHRLWDHLSNLDFGVLGTIIIGIFIVSWLASTIIYKVRKYDDIEVTIAAPKPRPRVTAELSEVR